MGCRWVEDPSVTPGGSSYVRASHEATSDTFSRDDKYSVLLSSQQKQ